MVRAMLRFVLVNIVCALAATTGEPYIVMFRKGTSSATIDSVADGVVKAGGSIKHRYSLIKGFAATIPFTYLRVVQSHEEVANVERDAEAHTWSDRVVASLQAAGVEAVAVPSTKGSARVEAVATPTVRSTVSVEGVSTAAGAKTVAVESVPDKPKVKRVKVEAVGQPSISTKAGSG